MGMDELEVKMKKLYNNVKSGKITKEIEEEVSEAKHRIEKLGEEAKDKFGDMMEEMKENINKFKEKF